MFSFRALRGAVLACSLVAAVTVGVVSVDAEPGLFHMVVDVESELAEFMERAKHEVRHLLRESHTPYADLAVHGGMVVVTIPQPADPGGAARRIEGAWPDFVVEQRGPQLQISLSPNAATDFEQITVLKALSRLRYIFLTDVGRQQIRKLSDRCFVVPEAGVRESRSSPIIKSSPPNLRFAFLKPEEGPGTTRALPAVSEFSLDVSQFGSRDTGYLVDGRSVIGGRDISGVMVEMREGQHNVVMKTGFFWQRRLDRYRGQEDQLVGIVVGSDLWAVRKLGELHSSEIVIDGLSNEEQANELAAMVAAGFFGPLMEFVEACPAD